MRLCVKASTAPQAVRDECTHPVAGNLVGTAPISLLSLPIVLAPVGLVLAWIVRAFGAYGMTAFAWFTVDRWMTQCQQVAHASRAWRVPVVGMLDVPLAMPALGLESMHGSMVSDLAVGLSFTLPLFTMILSRLVFEPPMPDALQPSLLILLAPFAVGTSTCVATTGQVDPFAQSPFLLTLCMLAVLLGRLRYLRARCPFKVSWRVVSFPLAASAIAGPHIAAASVDVVADTVAWLLLGLATVVIVLLLVRTLIGVAHGEPRSLSS